MKKFKKIIDIEQIDWLKPSNPSETTVTATTMEQIRQEILSTWYKIKQDQAKDHCITNTPDVQNQKIINKKQGWYDWSYRNEYRQNMPTPEEQIMTLHKQLIEEAKLRRRSMDEIARTADKRLALKKVLDENPGIAEQFEEMMTMLKLAGFDGDII